MRGKRATRLQRLIAGRALQCRESFECDASLGWASPVRWSVEKGTLWRWNDRTGDRVMLHLRIATLNSAIAAQRADVTWRLEDDLGNLGLGPRIQLRLLNSSP